MAASAPPSLPTSSTGTEPAAGTAPERIERVLTRAILRGTWAPGVRLPTVRELAVAHEVNPSTVQRALARLESRGLVTARQGSGVVVNDPFENGDLSLLADWLAVTADDPPRAAAILTDLLEVRRVLAVRLLVRHRLAVLDEVAELASGARQMTATSGDERWPADLAFARTVVAATGNTVIAAVLATIARAMVDLPVLVEAMYVDPARNGAAMLDVLAALRDGGDDHRLAARIEQTFVEIDALTVAEFERLLTARVADS